MKKVIFVLAMLMSYGLTLAEPTYFESHGDADHATLNACAIMPLTITNIYQPPVPLPAVITGWTRVFNPGTPTIGTDGGFENGSSGNYGWVFKLTKQEGNNYPVSLKCVVWDGAYENPNNFLNSSDVGVLKSRWYFYQDGATFPSSSATVNLKEDFVTNWTSGNSDAYMAFYLKEINALSLPPGKYTFCVNISGFYSAI